ncbi:MAG: RDD family protein [Actinomycetota bacterium]
MVAPYPAASPAVPAPGGDPTAVFGRRIVAFLIDVLLLAVPAVFLVSSSFEYIQADRVADPETFCDEYTDRFDGFCVDLSDVDDRIYFTEGIPTGGSALAWGGSLLLAVVLQGLTGWTPGKLVMGLRTVKADGSPVGIGRAFVRWILMIVDGQPCGLPLVGLITAGTSTGHRRVGDMAAKSFVVRASAAGAPIQVPGLAAGAGAGYGDTWSQPTPPPGAGWGTPPTTSPSSWDQPVAPAPGQWDQPSAPTGPSTPQGSPQWDEARGTYIQWDAAQGKWLQWDETARRWDVIPGQ